MITVATFWGLEILVVVLAAVVGFMATQLLRQPHGEHSQRWLLTGGETPAVPATEASRRDRGGAAGMEAGPGSSAALTDLERRADPYANGAAAPHVPEAAGQPISADDGMPAAGGTLAAPMPDMTP